jgi:chromosomal replication initiation ATPase DnaA
MPTMPLITIASLFGNRYYGRIGFDHSAILHNKNKLQDLLDTDPQIQTDVDSLLKMI